MARFKAPSPALVISCLALFVALGGVSVAQDGVAAAAKLITGKLVRDNSLTGKDIKDRSLVAKDFKAGSLPSGAAGPAGAKGDTGAAGAKGETGTVDTSNFYDKAASDDRFMCLFCTAADSDLLDGLDSTTFAVKVLQFSQATDTCDTGQLTQCAQTTVTVPAGRSYRASVWSTVTMSTQGEGARVVGFCAASADSCITPGGAVENFNLAANAFGNGASNGETLLGPGTHTLNTRVSTAAGLNSGSAFKTSTKVHLSDASLETLPTEP